MKSKKGGQFEREMSVALSEWWTDEDAESRTDIFWRSAASGARATARSKVGKKTFGNYGDLQAVDPVGSALTQLCTLELKRGYSKTSFADLLDFSRQKKGHEFAGFIEQARTQSSAAGTPYWLLITRRNNRLPMIFAPRALLRALLETNARKFNGYSVQIRAHVLGRSEIVVGMTFHTFSQSFSAADFRAVLSNFQSGKTKSSK